MSNPVVRGLTNYADQAAVAAVGPPVMHTFTSADATGPDSWYGPGVVAKVLGHWQTTNSGPLVLPPIAFDPTSGNQDIYFFLGSGYPPVPDVDYPDPAGVWTGQVFPYLDSVAYNSEQIEWLEFGRIVTLVVVSWGGELGPIYASDQVAAWAPLGGLKASPFYPPPAPALGYETVLTVVDGDLVSKVLPRRVGTGRSSTVEGMNIASAGSSHAEGSGTTASQFAAHAEGLGTTASGFYSHAEGHGATAAGDAAHAEGLSSATGTHAHAEGNGSSATGDSTHAEGSDTQATALAAHAEGLIAVASNTGAHAEGISTTASGQAAHAEGSSSIASGDSAHAEGYSTVASTAYAHAEGSFTNATNGSAHAEGNNSTASGYAAHAEGKSIASGDYAHAEGDCAAGGIYAHAEGYGSDAFGPASSATGLGAVASRIGEHAHGGGQFSPSSASIQASRLVLGFETTDNAWRLLLVGGYGTVGTSQFEIKNDCLTVLKGSIVARSVSGPAGVSVWNYSAIFDIAGGVISTLDNSGSLVVQNGDGVNWMVDVGGFESGSINAWEPQVRGVVGTTVRWTMTVDLVEVSNA